MRFHIKSSSYHHYACTMPLLCLYYAYYAYYASTMPLLCLYYAYYACTMPVLCLLCLLCLLCVLCLLCLFITTAKCVFYGIHSSKRLRDSMSLHAREKQLERLGFEAHRNQTGRNIPPGKN